VGFERITPGYAERLREAGNHLHDATAPAAEARARLRGLAGFASPYDVLCFLRWPVLREVMGGAPFLHMDLDLFFQPPLEDVAGLFAGRTLTFGSPCLAAVADPAWLDTWCDMIAELSAGREVLQADLAYAGNPVRRDIASDQDLLQGLYRTGDLPQPDMEALRQDFAIVLNPLMPNSTRPRRPLAASRQDGRDLLDGRPMLFWHFQTAFATYLGRYLCLERDPRRGGAFRQVKLDMPLLRLRPTADNFAFTILREQSQRLLRQDIAAGRLDLDGIMALTARGPADFFCRTVAARHFLLLGEGRGLLTGQEWWESGIFA
jgi:hypothetical protein